MTCNHLSWKQDTEIIMAAQKTLILALMATVVVGDGAFPGFKTDPNTTKYCTFWFDNDGTISCQDIVDNFVSGTKADFLRWVGGHLAYLPIRKKPLISKHNRTLLLLPLAEIF